MDASVMAPACHKPVIILGPGQAEQAHQSDKFVELWHLHQAAEFYRQLALNWLGCRTIVSQRQMALFKSKPR
jgi:acetylornithine deacetylase/succinyl-diaminopimelate desuccinylase-like protein